MPEYVREIIERLGAAGFEAFAVGGCVRDTLLDRVPHDWDVTTSASCGEVMALFEKTVPTGLRYGTVTVFVPGGQAEVTTFRRDGEYLNGRKPESVEFVAELREDLSRRDFTVNAMAMDMDGRIVDLFLGKEDLARGLIRCVGEPERRFSEDALRMLRAVRFSAQLGFEIEPDTLAAIKKLAPAAEKLSAERVFTELEKTLRSPRPESAALMIEYGLLRRFMKESGKKFHAELLRDAPPELRTAVFALLVRASGGADDAGALLRALRCPAKDVRLAGEAQTVYDELSKGTDDASLLRALISHDPSPVLAACAALGEYRLGERLMEEHRYTRPKELEIKGSDLAALGYRGEEISRELLELAVDVTFGKVANSRADLLQRARPL